MDNCTDTHSKASYRLPVIICLVALALSLVFSFVVFPEASGPQSLILDPDLHGNIAFSLLTYGTFSTYPSIEPTVGRGPAYPVFIALLVKATGGWYPGSVQVAQCILFMLVALMVYRVTCNLWGRRAGMICGIVAAVHPLLIWYTSRIWIETLAIWLLTLIVATMVWAARKPSIGKAIVLGVVMALAGLCKQTFVVYILIVPLLMVLNRRDRLSPKLAILSIAVACTLIAPWTVRNYRLTGRFIPVHGRAVFNMWIGDRFAEDYTKAPLSLSKLWDMNIGEGEALRNSLPKDLPGAKKEVMYDDLLLKRCIAKYKDEPFFLVKKTVYGAIMFWTVGQTPKKSIVVSAMLLPLLGVFLFAGGRTIRRFGARSLPGSIIVMVLLYWAMHAPMEGIARYSVVLIPAMLISIGALFADPKKPVQEEPVEQE